jgi:peptide chain release factor 2
MGEAEGDQSIVGEAENSIKAMAVQVRERQIETLLSGEADGNDTYLEIHAGAGGTESQDWANMLLRMYTRWAERRKFKVEVLERRRRRSRHQVGHDSRSRATTLMAG